MRFQNPCPIALHVAATLTVSLLLAAPLGAQARPRDPFAGFDAYATQAMAEWKVPGMAIAVVRGDSILLARGYGVRTLGDTARVDARTMFAIGSASKAFTGAALSMLVDDGTMSYDAPVTDHLPGFQMYDPWVTREIRVRDLLLHRSGLERGEALWYGTARSREEVVRAVRHLAPTTSFRSRFQYQNLMYITAGEVIHAVAGASWDDVIRQRILAPLGMHETSTTVRALVGRPNVASPHADLGEGVRPIPWRNIDNAAAAGSINSNVLEMSRWISLWLGRGKLDGKRILSEAMANESIAQHTVVDDPEFHARLMAPRYLGYGYGWFVSEHQGRRLISHGGNIDGMAALVSFMPDDSIGIVILTNLNQSDLTIPLSANLYDRLLGLPVKDYSPGYRAAEAAYAARLAAGRRTPVRLTGTTPSLPLAAYAGTYRNPLLGTATVTLDANGGLVAGYDAHLTAKGPLEHVQLDAFMMRTNDLIFGKIPVTFRIAPDGHVASMSMPIAGSYEWVKDRR